MMHCIWFSWCILIWTGTFLCVVGCLAPYWLTGILYLKTNIQINNNDNNYHLQSTMNLFRRCVYPIYKLGYHQSIDVKGISGGDNVINTVDQLHIYPVQSDENLIQINTQCGYYQFSNIPHFLWKLGLVALIVACCLLIFLAFLLTFMGFYLRHLWLLRTVQRCCQAGLLFSGSLVLLSCILFPIGWHNNQEFVQICGKIHSRFDLGYCQIGWAYLVTVIGGILIITSVSIPNLCYNLIGPSANHNIINNNNNNTNTNTTGITGKTIDSQNKIFHTADLDPLQIFTNKDLIHQTGQDNQSGHMNFISNCEFVEPTSSTNLHLSNTAIPNMDWFSPYSEMNSIIPCQGHHVLLTRPDMPINQAFVRDTQLGYSQTTINSLGASSMECDKKMVSKPNEDANQAID